MDQASRLLKSEYGIISDSIFPVTGGFSTKAAYRVADLDGIHYFVKVYDKSLPTTRFFVERIDTYMPVLDWLSTSPALCGRILTPIPAQTGAYKVEANADVYVVFLYIWGEVPDIQRMTRAQTVELAEILAHLHDIDKAAIPFETPDLAEDISLPFCDQLMGYLSERDAKYDVLDPLVSPHGNMLRTAIRETLYLRDATRLEYSPLVLCHGDAHGNNVIQSKRLVLADWEGLRLAPAEADLFIHAWHPHGDTLLEAYAAARNKYRINHELLRFYTLSRRIEDIWVDIQRLTEESPDEVESAKLLNWINQGIKEVQIIL